MTTWDIAMHFTHWNNPELQRFIVRVLWMVPVYSCESIYTLNDSTRMSPLQ